MSRFLKPDTEKDDPRRCRVCGNYTISRPRRIATLVLAVLLGAALCYITLDIAENGRLDGSLFTLIIRGQR